MPFRFHEKPTSRSANAYPRSATLEYFASGTADASYVMAYAINATPLIYDGLYRQDVQISAVASDQWDITVPYSWQNRVTYDLDFDTTGGTIHIQASRETVGAYGGAANVNDYKGMIGVHADQVDGVDVVIPALKLSVKFQHQVGALNIDRIKALARMTGKVNSDPFLTFAAGEVLFLGCTGSQGTATPTNVAYQFACSENAQGLTIGQIAGIAKKGHEYVWIRYKPEVVNGAAVMQAQSAYVERLYEATNFQATLGFG